jgi:hypothetical protein
MEDGLRDGDGYENGSSLYEVEVGGSISEHADRVT